MTLRVIIKGHSITCREGTDGKQRYNSTLSLTSALDRGGRLTPIHGRLTPGKEMPYPLYMRLGGPQGRSGRVRKTATGIRSPDPQPLASCYTDLAISAHHVTKLVLKYSKKL
jgi:hypothetical protein